MQPYELTITQALAEMEKGALSGKELTSSCLERIKAIDDDIRSFVTVDAEGALQQAARADEKRQAKEGGRLCGIPLAIKDLLCTRGVKTTCGSKMLENFIPPYDATSVRLLKDQDAVVIGKTTMDEFAMGSTSETCAFGVPRNPWKKGYVAGGSSGGSATAVAALEAPGSLGSDTGGSIRQPASLCGIVGMKPTYGRVSRYGLTAFASSLDQVGPLCRSVEDCALMMEVISGYDNMDSTSVDKPVDNFSKALVDDMNGMTVGVPSEYFSAGIDADVEKIVRNSIKMLEERGAKVVEISIPHTEYCVAVYYLIAPSEASSNLARYDGVLYGYRAGEADSLMDMYKTTRSQGFGSEVKRRILIGTYALSSGYYDAYYKKASQVRTLLLEDFKSAFTKCDVLISPVTPTPAWKMGENTDDPLAVYMSDILTLSANLAGIPGMSVPGGFTADGLPVGIQLQGAHFREDNLLRTAYNIEKGLGLQPGKLDI